MSFLVRGLFPLIAPMPVLHKLPVVNIDPNGVFKYILIKASDGVSEAFLVRGYRHCKFHADILEEVQKREGENAAVKFSCVGGGRVKHESEAKRIFVYGYSQGFGRADHAKTVELLKAHFPDYEIGWSNDGY